MLIKNIALISNHINNSKPQTPETAALNIKETYLHFIHDNSNATSLCHICFMQSCGMRDSWQTLTCHATFLITGNREKRACHTTNAEMKGFLTVVK